MVRGPIGAVVAAGEFDISRRDAFRVALRTAADTGRDVYLDARHIRFLEARAVAVIDEVAVALAPHRRLVVVDPPPIVQLVMSVRRSADPDARTTV